MRILMRICYFQVLEQGHIKPKKVFLVETENKSILALNKSRLLFLWNNAYCYCA